MSWVSNGKVGGQTVVTITQELAWRRNYWITQSAYFPDYNAGPGQPIATMKLGSLKYSIAKRNGNTIVTPTQDLLYDTFQVWSESTDYLKIDSLSDVNWIRGTQSYDFTVPDDNEEYFVYLYSGARLDTLLDTNGGCYFNVAMNIRINDGALVRTRSPKTAGSVREYLEGCQETNFAVPFVEADSKAASVYPSVSRCTVPAVVYPVVTIGSFTGNLPINCLNRSTPTLKCSPSSPPFTLGTDGQFSWFPPVPNQALCSSATTQAACTVKINKDKIGCFWDAIGLTCEKRDEYAIQFTVKENSGALFSTYDVIFEVSKQCLASDNTCNHAPHFSPRYAATRTPNYNTVICGNVAGTDCPVLRGVEAQLAIVAVDYDVTQTVTASYTLLPYQGFVFAGPQSLSPDRWDQGIIKATSPYYLKWIPAIDAPDVILCWQALDSLGKFSNGNYCLNLVVKDTEYIYVSGIIRDFSSSHPDFGRPETTADNGAQWVMPYMDNGKPIQKAGVAVSTVSRFNQWFNTIPGVNQQTVFSVQLIKKGAEDRFTYGNTNFLPIQNRLLGNDDTPTGGGNASRSGINTFFTWEVHTYLIFNASSNVPYTYSSSDDLWVFINGVLVPNWMLHGIHAPKSQVIDLKLLYNALGFDNSTLLYRVDMFYAMRSLVRTQPVIQMELPKAVLCDALSSGVQQLNYNFSITPAQFMTGTGLFTIGSSSLTPSGYSILDQSQASAVAYAANTGGVPTRVKVLQGFQTTFEFHATRPTTQGFAFVMSPQNSLGIAGNQIGYGGLTGAIVIEFDMNIDPTDPNYQHVAVMAPFLNMTTGFQGKVYSSHNYALETSQYDPSNAQAGPFLNMSNGTRHFVRITYAPPQSTDASAAKQGWLRVWLGKIVRPVVEVPIIAGFLAATLGDAAYVGFTSGAGTEAASSILIDNWQLIVVPPAPTATEIATWISSAVAGQDVTVRIQARDSCGNAILVGADQDRYSAVFQVTSSGRVVTAGIATLFTTNNDGTYNFRFSNRVVGVYQVSVMFDGDPIKNSPFPLTITPGPTSILQTNFVFASLSVIAHNALTTTTGLYMLAVDPASGSIFSRVQLSDATAVLTWLNTQAGQIIAVSSIGTFKSTTPGLVTKFNAMGCTNFNLLASAVTASWVCVANVTGARQLFAAKEATDELKVDFAQFSIIAQSDAVSGLGRLNVYRPGVFAASNTANKVAIIARDQYGNINTGSTDSFSLSFSPTLTGAVGSVLPAGATGYFVANFATTVASFYTMSIALLGQGGGNILKIPSLVQVVAGIASPLKSTVSGIAYSNSQGGVTATFSLQLIDAFGNQIRDGASAVGNQVSVSFNHVVNSTIISTTKTWSTSGSEYLISYTPTFVGQYRVNMVINGGNATVAANAIMVVIAGPLYAPACTYSSTSEAIARVRTSALTTMTAGNVESIWVQTRDKFGQARSNSADVISFQVIGGARNILNQTYAGFGLFVFSFIPTVAPATLILTLTANGTGVGTPGIKSTSVPVKVGVPSSRSTLPVATQTVIAGTDYKLNVACFDSEGNAIPNCPTSPFSAAMLTTSGVPSGILVLSTGTSNLITVTVRANFTGPYTGDVRVGGLSLVNSPVNIIVKPAITDNTRNGQSTPPSGDGAFGGVETSNTSFLILCKDRFGNVQNHNNDNITFAVRGIPGTKLVAVSPGLWQAFYAIPPAYPNSTYNITYTINNVLSYVGTATSILNSATCATYWNGQIYNVKAGYPLTVQVPYSVSGANITANSSSFSTFNKTVFLVRIENASVTATVFQFTTIVDKNQLIPFVGTFTGLQTVGTYTITAFADRVVKCSPGAIVRVAPGDVHPPATSFSGLTTQVVAGTSSGFTVRLRDKYAQNISDSSNVLVVKFSYLGTPANTSVFTSVYNNATGTYYFNFTLLRAGAYSVSVDRTSAPTLTGLGSPPSVQVSPGIPVAAASLQTFPSSLVAGTSVTSVVKLSDAFGNRVTNFNASRWTVGLKLNTITPNPLKITVSVADGSISLDYTPTAAGSVAITITLLNNGAAAGNIPPLTPVIVLAGPIAIPPTFVIAGPTTVAGNPVNISLVARDAYNNPIKGASLTALAMGADNLRFPEATERANGVYDLTLRDTTVAGSYKWTIQANAQVLAVPIANTTIVPGSVNWNRTQVPGLPGTIGVGTKVDSTVQLMDVYGNNVLTSSAAGVALLMIQPASLCGATSEAGDVPVNTTGTFLNISVTAISKGRLQLSYRPIVMGVYRLYLTLNGVPNQCNDANIITVAPGQVYPPASEISITNVTTAETADVKIARIVLRDVYGNPIEDNNCKFLQNFSFGNHSYGSVQPSANWLRPQFTVTCVFENRILAYYIKFNASVAGNWLSVVVLRYLDTATNSELYNVIRAPQPLLVRPGKAASFVVPTDANGDLLGTSFVPRATIPGGFQVTAADAYGNKVQDTKSYTIDLTCTLYSSINGAALYDMDTSIVPGAQAQNLSFFSTRNGLFLCEAKLVLPPNIFVMSGTFKLKIAPALCPDGKFRCQDGVCVSAYTQCSDILPLCAAATPVRCWDKSCKASSSACPCANSSHVRCTQGNCVASLSSCPSDEPCPVVSPYKCTGGECRADASGCPSTVVCPPGYVICPDSVTCVSELRPALSGCPAVPSCNASQFACTTGKCVNTREDCPTPTTCPSGQVLCAEGSCRSSYTLCPSLYPCPTTMPYRCSDGTCTLSVNTCPSAIACPWGMVQCSNGECLKNVSSCPAQVICPAGTLLCSTGACALNQFLCPSPPSCPSSQPVMCPDRSCVSASTECVAPQYCPPGYNKCPDGSCTLLALPLCPVTPTCPSNMPILCTNGQCTNSTKNCVPTQACPIATPLRCPDGACRIQLLDCATPVTCPAERPVKCADGYCAADISVCASPALLKCPAPLLQCFYGECVPYLSACPPHSTCSADTMRCEDGTCRANCSAVIFISQCPSPQVQCPQAAAGKSCADRLADCPPSWTCPLTAPMRCFDGSCRATLSECPATPSYDSIGNSIPCPDGSWSPDGVCGTPPFCSAGTFLCPNRQCVDVQADCPVVTVCGATPATANKPLLCGTVCVSDLAANDCSSTGVRCKPDTPFLCLDGSCRASLAECSSAERVDPMCPTGDRCRDGSCQVNCPSYASLCLAFSLSTPWVCPDGMCAKTSKQCNAANGCPFSAPLRCPNSGECVSDRRNCSNIVCPDGKWQVFGFCLSDNAKEDITFTQCPATLPLKCFDKRCVDEFSKCTETGWGSSTLLDSPPNQCPLAARFRCPNGFCASASNMCPNLASDFCATSPVGLKTACADGSCVTSSLYCPLIVPCTSEQTRCPDGVCRDNAFVATYGCPVKTGCPAAYPVRCSDGLCASAQELCLDPDTMCPLTLPIRCPNGICISISDSQDQTKDCDTLAQPGNGCPSENLSFKCWNGECVNAESNCLSRQLCPSATPHRCPYSQKCVANTATDCGVDLAVNTSTCPPPKAICRSCETDASKCVTITGCPMDQTVRCADGQCAAFEATGFGPESQRCRPTVVCDKNTFLCADGSCVYDLSACGPFPNCPAGTTLCSDHTCSANCANRCPVSSPITCKDGTCTSQAQSCPGVVGLGAAAGGVLLVANGPDTFTGISSGCDSLAAPVRCFDGSCKATYRECYLYAQALDKAFGGTLLSCSPPFTVCSDGSCAPDSVEANPGALCPVLSRCPSGTFRSGDGSCRKNFIPPAIKCKRGELLCEDGMCRPFCLPYDGCPMSAPYHCPNRNCASSPEGCAHQTSSQGVDTSFYLDRRRLLATAPKQPCYSNCNSQVKAQQLTVEVDPSFTTRFDFALNAENVPIASMTVPSGSLVSTSQAPPSLQIRPVADSVMRFAENAVHPSRHAEFGAFLPYSETLLSVAFECVVDPSLLDPFPLNLTFSALIDSSREPLTQFDDTKIPSGPDVCLAFLYRIPSLYYSRWVCVDEKPSVRKEHPPNTLPPTSSQKYRVQGPVPTCGKNSQGQIYGFIHSPLPLATISTIEEQSWASRNKLGVILIFLSVAVVLCSCCFFFHRMSRYIHKFEKEAQAVDQMEEEVRDMEQFGGGAGIKDDEVQMVSNPLVVQTSDMWELLSMTEEQKRKQQHELREAEAAKESRLKYKMELIADRDRLSEELLTLQSRFKESQGEMRNRSIIEPDTHFVVHPEAVGASFSVVGAPDRSIGAPPLPPTRRPLGFAKPPKKKDLGI